MGATLHPPMRIRFGQGDETGNRPPTGTRDEPGGGRGFGEEDGRGVVSGNGTHRGGSLSKLAASAWAGAGAGDGSGGTDPLVGEGGPHLRS